ncbi:hypothetical protein [Cognatilysobacter tabacisoli]|uniref:hypothetical protein n=1 Tax=Cognatilysobacter tabacisoli TaxID=2315424 RepID=UPI000E6AE6BA|nr:hypothetical protein [Lysobacter tabacisoli]
MILQHRSTRSARRPLLCTAATLILTLAAGTAAANGYPYGSPTPVDGSFSCKDFDTANLLTEFTVVPPADGVIRHNDGTLDVVTIHYPSTNGFIVDWIQMVAGPNIHHVVVRNEYGGNAYSYDPPRMEDRGLRAPAAPGITVATTPPNNAAKGVSYCYSVPRVGVDGCTLGYWKVRKHHDSWPAAYNIGSPLQATFGANAFDETFLEALNYKGGPGIEGGKRILLKQAVAALLNSASDGVAYPLTTAQVVTQVTFALNSADRGLMISLASTLDAYNNQGCPLN